MKLPRHDLLGVVPLAFALLAVCLPNALDAQTFGFYDNFSSTTFSNGDLVGQQSWQQLASSGGSPSNLPIQVSDGKVWIPGDQTGDNQDAYKNIGQVTNPVLFAGIVLTVTNAPATNSATPSFIVALNTYTNPTVNVGGAFNNYRLTARDTSSNSSTYVFGTRITGQGGNPYSFGTTPLNYGTTYRVIIQTDSVGSNTAVYVNPTSGVLSNQTPYVTNNVGTGTPPLSIGAFVISQFQSAIAPICGAAIGKVAVSTNFADVYNFLTSTNSWIDGTGKWETGGNWSSVTAPSTSDLANLITNAGNNTVTIDATTTNFPSTMTISNLTVSAPSGSTNTLFLNNAGTATALSVLNLLVSESNGVVAVNHSLLQSSGNLFVGNSGAGNSLVISNGGAAYNATGYVGFATSASNNSVLVTGTGSVWSNRNDLYVGNSGSGNRLTITNGGKVFNFNSAIGSCSSSNNVVVVTGTGSVWSNQQLGVGYCSLGGSNSLTIADGAVVYSGRTALGLDGASHNNIALVTGAGSVWNAVNMTVGHVGAGNLLTITNGGAVYNLGGGVGSENSNNVAIVTGAGSVWSNGLELHVGTLSSSNRLTIANGGKVFSNTGTIGRDSIASNNVVVVTGPGSVWQNEDILSVGAMGSGNRLIITNGGAVFNNDGPIGSSSGSSSNTVTVGGNGAMWSNLGNLTVGGSGSTNTLTIDTGGSVLASNAYVGFNSPSVGNRINVTGGSLFVTNAAGTATLIVGQSGRGIYTQNGGTVTVDQLVVTNHPTDALFQLQGGALFTKATVYSNVVLNVGTAGNSATLNFQGTTHSLLDALTLAPSAGSTGTVWMIASQLMVGSASIGLNGVGQMTVSNGTWQVGGLLRVGVFAGARGTLTVAGGTSSVLSNLTIGDFPCTPTGTVVVAGGSLFVTNSTASAVLEVRTGSLTLNSGTLTIDKLVITNSCGNITLNAGTLNTSSTTVNNGSIVNVGNGTNGTTLHLNGGIHSFANNLRVRNNATLSGCGTVTGNVLVDSGGTVLADCGGALNFSGTVTNNGSIVVINGTVLNFFGPVVNNGSIIATNGIVEFYGGVVNNGTILPNSWIDGNGKWETPGNWSAGSAPSTNDPADFITKAGNNIVTIDATTTGSFPSTLTINSLVLSAPVGSSNTLALTVGGTNTPLRVLNRLTLDGRGVLTVSNSALRTDGDLIIGSSGSSNRLTVTTGSRLGSVTSVIGSNATATGNTVLVTGTNSLWNTTNLVIGVAGSDNLLSISNAARVSISGTFTVGSGPSITGNRIETVDGGILEVAQAASVGGTNSGQATFDVTGGTTILSSNLVAGSSAGSTGIVNVTDGGELVVTNGVLGIGNDGALTNGSGTGFLTVSNGTLTASDILLGSSTGGEGLLTILPGGVVTAPAGCTNCGITANGIVVAGGTIIMPDLAVGETHPGEMTISNGVALFTNAVIGVDNTGTLTMLDGTFGLLSNLLVGAGSTATGIVMITGGTTTVSNGVFGVGNNGTIGGTGGVGRVTVSNGLFEAASVLIGDTVGGESSFTVASNGYVRVKGGLRANGIRTTLINGGTLEVLAGPPPPFEDPVLHNRIVVSYLGHGKLVVSNGTVKAPEMLVGASAGKTGTVEVAGGTVNLSSNLLVGMTASATGIVTITGGSLIVTNGVFAVGNNGTVGGAGGFGRVAVSNGIVEAASILVGDISGGDSGLTVAGSGHVRAHGGLRANGIKTTLVNGGTLEVVAGPPPSFEDPILHDRIVVSYLADGRLVVSNGTVRTPGMLVGASAGNTGSLQLAGGTTSVFSNMTAGFIGCTSTGIVNVTGGSLYVTNGGTAVLEVRSGPFTLSAGTVIVDKLVITNACGRFLKTGGTLSITTTNISANLDADGDGLPNSWETGFGLSPFSDVGNDGANGDSDGDGFTNLQEYLTGTDPTNSVSAFRITAIARQVNTNILVTWTMGSGKTNALERSPGTPAGSYSNNFAAIFTVTNTVGTTTNYLDVGAATNFPSRYYRVRLVP